METKALSDLKPGDRLARAVYSAEGKLLFPAGEVLSREMLEILKSWSIPAVSVFDGADAPARPSGETAPDDALAAAREIVGRRFQTADLQNPCVAVLFAQAVERQARAMPGGQDKNTRAPKPAPAFTTGKPEPASLEALIDASGKMGTLPMVFHRLVEIINSPYASAADAAKVIATDPAISAKLLRLVNSAFYGLATRIDTISRAVVLVGTGQLVMLAMGATLITAFKGMPVSLISMQSFLNHTIACGVAARTIARQLGLSQPESWFVSGLLHDISRLLIYTQLPGHSLYLLTESRRRNVSVHSLERETLGFTHEELSAALLRNWRCPEEIALRIGRHHMELAPDAGPEDAVLPTANMVVQALGHGSSGEALLPGLNPVAWGLAGLDPENLPSYCDRLDEGVREMRNLLTNQE